MGEENKGGNTIALLVAKERNSRAILSTVAPRKSSGDWLARRVLAWMREIGCELNHVTVKSDNEPALVEIVDSLARHRAAKGGQRMLVEHSLVHSSKSNGCIERGVQTAQGMIRTMRSALEARWNATIPVDHAVWTWLAELGYTRRGRTRWKNTVRTPQGQEGETTRARIWRAGALETQTRRRSPR